jgi:hypothetical protein
MKLAARQALIPALALTALIASPGLAEEKETVSAIAASAKLPLPSFRDVHAAYFRLTVHESGLTNSLPDQDGILAALLNSGGGRIERSGRGTGYGLDYRRMMSSMLANSPRTFPSDSPFLIALSPGRITQVLSAKGDANRWATTLKLNCQEPDFWNPDFGLWRVGYQKRCLAAVKSTELMLKGKIATQCTGPITAWGSYTDRHRKGGPLDQGWNEFTCDRPPVYATDPPAAECPALREQSGVDKDAYRRLLNTGNCARNFFFSWRKDDRSYALR